MRFIIAFKTFGRISSLLDPSLTAFSLLLLSSSPFFLSPSSTPPPLQMVLNV